VRPQLPVLIPWPLALIAGLLPALGAVIAFSLSTHLELIPACNPLIDGCVSVSRAARYDLPNYIFRALVLPGAVLQAVTWLLCTAWLISWGAQRRIRLRLLPWLGLAAAVFLVIYAAFLGTDGQTYRWLRRYGTLVYFGCTYLSMLITVGELSRLMDKPRAVGMHRLARILHGLCLLMLALGLAHAVGAAYFAPAAKNRIENVTEWWLGVGFTLYFVVLALLWRRTGFALHADCARD
jgi:hypothetical protein